MICKNCNNVNNEGAKFCIKCGQSLAQEVTNVNIEVVQAEMPVQNEEVVNTQVEVSTPVQSEPVATPIVETQAQVNVAPQVQNTVAVNSVPVNNDVKVPFLEYLFMIIAMILKPFNSYKEDTEKFNGFKNSAIMTLIVSGLATIIKLFTLMLSVVRVKDYSWTTGKTETKWVFENLKEIKYFEVIGKNFLIFLGIIVAIAFVYWLVGLIFKKQANFSRLLGISALGVTPILIASLVLSPLLTLIWEELGMIIVVIGAIYTFVILYEGLNSEISLEGNAKYYMNLICLCILAVAGAYLSRELIMGSITGGYGGLGDLDDLMDMFG